MRFLRNDSGVQWRRQPNRRPRLGVKYHWNPHTFHPPQNRMSPKSFALKLGQPICYVQPMAAPTAAVLFLDNSNPIEEPGNVQRGPFDFGGWTMSDSIAAAKRAGSPLIFT